MKLKIAQEKLAKALNIASRIATPKAGLPILNNILFRTDQSKLTISATNLEIAIIENLDADITKPGTITIPAKLLTEFINNLPKTTLTLEAKDNHLHINSDNNYKSTINGIDSDEFPELPILDDAKARSLKVRIDDFKESVSQTIVTSSNDTTRPSLTGVYFNTFEGSLYLASTDGYRLSEKRLATNIENEFFSIIPTTSLQEVLRSISEDMEEIEILFDDNQVKFRLGEIEITSKIIDGSFPDYRQLIPKKTDINLKLDRDELLRVTKLAGLFARESGGSIMLETDSKAQTLSIKSIASELGENSSSISTKVDNDGKITLNSKFLIDALGCISDKNIVFNFSGKLAPVVIKNQDKNSDYIHIIMPLKS